MKNFRYAVAFAELLTLLASYGVSVGFGYYR
jgi:hypothetical protein